MSRRWLVRTLVFGLLLMLTLNLPAPAAVVCEEPPAQPDVLVMSFNIRYGTAKDGENHWDKRRDMVCELLQRQSPDLVGLQEALRFQIDEIRSALPQYAEIGCGRDDGKTLGEYSGILYRKNRFDVNDSGTFWLSDTPEVPGSITWGNACTRLCTWGRFVPKGSGKAFYMFNTHLDHISQLSRDKAIVLIASKLRDRRHPDPIVFTGDFNVGESNSVARYLRGEAPISVASDGLTQNPIPLVDTFRVLHPDAKDVGTFNGFKGTRTGQKIDYIFVQPGVEVLKAEILYDNHDNRYPSDHFPITAAIRWPKP